MKSVKLLMQIFLKYVIRINMKSFKLFYPFISAPYVKVYLLEGKQCIAKAKTRAVRRTTRPIFQQHIVFSETPRKKMLQVV